MKRRRMPLDVAVPDILLEAGKEWWSRSALADWGLGDLMTTNSKNVCSPVGQRRWWVSWYQPTEDYRPLQDPPESPSVLGWWCSGWREDDGAHTLCAVVQANNKTEVRRRIRLSWPEAKEWRFMDENPSDWLPPDRFRIDKPWSRARFGLGAP